MCFLDSEMLCFLGSSSIPGLMLDTWYSDALSNRLPKILWNYGARLLRTIFVLDTHTIGCLTWLRDLILLFYYFMAILILALTCWFFYFATLYFTLLLASICLWFCFYVYTCYCFHLWLVAQFTFIWIISVSYWSSSSSCSILWCSSFIVGHEQWKWSQQIKFRKILQSFLTSKAAPVG